MNGITIHAIFIGAMMALAPQAQAQFSNPAAQPLSAMTVPQAQLMQPAELVPLLKASGARPLVLQVGSRVMFAQAHIPGSVYAGPGSQAAGLQLLERAVAFTSKNKLIVIYCGCCPWNHCPNIGPAYKRLKDLGFTHVKALYMANNFGDDWMAKGYPVDKGE
ncbi:MAG: rhodanese-like domain-containing protein [Terracidiphilus sp.]